LKSLLFLLALSGCAPMCQALDKPATEATAQSINNGLTSVKTELENLTNEIRNSYGGLEYVLMAIVQAFYFTVGLALFYIFDRGRVYRDIW